MRSLNAVPQYLVLAACLFMPAVLLHAQNPAAPPAGAGGLAPTAPQAPEEGMATYPVPPEGFNVARENIPHGELKVV